MGRPRKEGSLARREKRGVSLELTPMVLTCPKHKPSLLPQAAVLTVSDSQSGKLRHWTGMIHRIDTQTRSTQPMQIQENQFLKSLMSVSTAQKTFNTTMTTADNRQQPLEQQAHIMDPPITATSSNHKLQHQQIKSNYKRNNSNNNNHRNDNNK